MKKTLLGVILGILLGAGAMWLFGPSGPLGSPVAAPAAKTDAAPAADEPTPGTVTLESDEQDKAGIKTARPTAMEFKPEAKGFARVLDASSLAAELVEIDSDAAALTASSNEYQRLQKLKASDNTSARALDAAEAAMRHDGFQLDAAKAKVIADWGRDLAGRADLPDLAKALLTQKSALIRVEMLGGETLPAEPRTVRVTPVLGNADPVAVEVIGPAPSADLQSQGVAFFALLKENPPVPGTQLLAWMVGSADGEKGLQVPGNAIIRHEGDTFVYVHKGSEEFERVRVKLGATLRDGSAFIDGGLTAQDDVVINGAQQLLSAELKSASGG